MSIGEQISRGIHAQISHQPDSWKNAASRFIDRTFGVLIQK